MKKTLGYLIDTVSLIGMLAMIFVIAAAIEGGAGFGRLVLLLGIFALFATPAIIKSSFGMYRNI